MRFGSSSSLTVRQWGKIFTVYISDVVPQARLPCLRLFSCLDIARIRFLNYELFPEHPFNRKWEILGNIEPNGLDNKINKKLYRNKRMGYMDVEKKNHNVPKNQVYAQNPNKHFIVLSIL